MAWSSPGEAAPRGGDVGGDSLAPQCRSTSSHQAASSVLGQSLRPADPMQAERHLGPWGREESHLCSTPHPHPPDIFPQPDLTDEGLARPVLAGIVATICFLAAAILFSTLAACFVNKQRKRKLKRKKGGCWLENRNWTSWAELPVGLALMVGEVAGTRMRVEVGLVGVQDPGWSGL